MTWNICSKIGTLADVLQANLFDETVVGLGPLDKIRRTELTRGAWVDVLPGWLTGADELYEKLAADVPWQAERRRMYDRVVDVPRLLCFYDESAPLPLPRSPFPCRWLVAKRFSVIVTQQNREKILPTLVAIATSPLQLHPPQKPSQLTLISSHSFPFLFFCVRG